MSSDWGREGGVSSLWVMEFIVETTPEVPHKCGYKTNSARQYLPAALWPQQMKMNDRTILWHLKTSLGGKRLNIKRPSEEETEQPAGVETSQRRRGRLEVNVHPDSF